MNENKKPKYEKYWLNIGILLAGVLGSLFLVYFSYKKYTDTAEQYPVPKEIINIKDEIEPSLETLKASDKSVVEKYRSIKSINKILGENDLGFTHRWLSSIVYSLKLKQKLYYSKKTSQSELKEIVDDLDTSLMKSFLVSLWYKSLQENFEKDIASQIPPHLKNITYQTFSNNSHLILAKTIKNKDINIVAKIINIENKKINRNTLIELEEYQKDINDYLKPHQKLDRNYLILFLTFTYFKSYDFSQEQIDKMSIQHFINSFEEFVLESEKNSYFIDYVQRKNSYIDEDLLKEMLIVNQLETKDKFTISEEKIDRILDIAIQNLIQTLNIELSNSYGLEENNKGITSLHKKTKLILLFQLGYLSCLAAFYMIIKIIINYSLIINSNDKNIFFMPEECIAELEVIHKELKSSDINTWIIRFIMLWNIIVLLKSIYIQVAIENILLPGKNKRD